MKNKIMFITKCLSVHKPPNFFCRGRIWDEHISWMEINLVLMVKGCHLINCIFWSTFQLCHYRPDSSVAFSLQKFQFKRNHQFIIALNYTIASDFRKCLIQTDFASIVIIQCCFLDDGDINEIKTYMNKAQPCFF